MFTFPRTVNEKAARVVAGVVAITGIVALATGAHWLLVPLAYGFWARVLSGPTLSPLAQFATRVAAPRLGPPTDVSGPPKRFAQAMGAVMTTAGAIAALGFGAEGVADVLLVALIVAATLESVFAFCVGCRIFGLLTALGVVPAATCEACADVVSPSRG